MRLFFASTGCTNSSVLLLVAKSSLSGPTRERLALGRLVGILLALIHLLLELLCLFIVRKAEACHAILQLKTVEEGPVLVVVERVVDFLVP